MHAQKASQLGGYPGGIPAAEAAVFHERRHCKSRLSLLIENQTGEASVGFQAWCVRSWTSALLPTHAPARFCQKKSLKLLAVPPV